MSDAATPFAPEPVRRAREQVESQLREAILSGLFKRGEKLPSEAELAARFSVSRTTVREALRALVSAGLIAKVPGASGGSFVQAVDHHALEAVLSESMDNILRLGSVNYSEVAAVRRLLELPAARHAALHRSDDDIRRLEELVNQESSVKVDDPSVPELDIGFHSAIAAASGNRLLSSFVSALHGVTRPVMALNLSEDVGRQTVRQHKAIVRAIVNGDADGAEAAMAEHLNFVEQRSDHSRD